MDGIKSRLHIAEKWIMNWKKDPMKSCRMQHRELQQSWEVKKPVGRVSEERRERMCGWGNTWKIDGWNYEKHVS